MWTEKDLAILLHLTTACMRSAEVCPPMCISLAEWQGEIQGDWLQFLPVFRQRLSNSLLLRKTGRICCLATWATLLTRWPYTELNSQHFHKDKHEFSLALRKCSMRNNRLLCKTKLAKMCSCYKAESMFNIQSSFVVYLNCRYFCLIIGSSQCTWHCKEAII